MQELLFLGIDGGGTKTEAWLGVRSDTHSTGHSMGHSTGEHGWSAIGVGIAGPSNLHAVGFDAAMQNVRQAIILAFQDVGIAQACVRRACFCLAGAGRPSEQERVKRWAAQQRISKNALVVHDAEALLAATELETGIALIVGTGSLAWGRNAEGHIARCGGWGYLIDDVGSGYAIGLDCLRAIVQAADGRSAETDLASPVLEQLKLKDAREMIAWIYQQPLPRQQIADLSSIVFEHESTDKAASEIVDHGATQLAKMVGTVAKKLGWSEGNENEGFALVLGGGVIVNQPIYREKLIKVLWAIHPHPAAFHRVENPVAGALALSFLSTSC